MTFAPIHPDTRKRLGQDYARATATPPFTTTPQVNWRVVPVRYWYKKNRPQIRWVIFRCGRRMWTKTSLPGALDYIRRHA